MTKEKRMITYSLKKTGVGGSYVVFFVWLVFWR